MKTPSWLTAAISFAVLWPTVASSQLQITEVLSMATPDDKGKNPEQFLDEDEHLSDMIEIYNPGDTAVGLGGYHLTDDKDNLTLWTFPSNQSVGPGEYKVVYASAKDKRGLFNAVPHTNFKLSRNEEYLALVSPSGEIVSELDLPLMFANVSYGPEGHMKSTSFGAANKAALANPTHQVDFSIKSRTFTGELVLELSSDNLPEGARIGYTTNRGEPAVSLFSPPKYFDATGPITITETTQIRARVFEDGKLPGEIKTENYFLVNDELQDWNSNLPVIVIDSFGASYTKARFSESAIMFLMPQDGAEAGAEKRTSVIQEAEIESRMNARQRGSSTGGWPKKSLAMEMWLDDANGADRDISPFGMPADGDWVLSGRYEFDRALMRNPLSFRLASEMGHWAPRTQFVEVFMNQNDNEVDAGDYVGVFDFMEKIELHPERINLQDPTGREDGGFMVKVDRTTGQTGTSDTTFSAAGQTFVWIEPEKEFVTTGQNNKLRDHFNNIQKVMRDDAIAEDPVDGYRSMIDVESWIDEYVVRTLTKDPDGFRLSTYLYMPRNGKVHYGPVWDFDRTMGCDTDDRARRPDDWANVSYFQTHGWLADILGSGFHAKIPTAKRPEFLQDWIDRYQFHRRTVLDVDHMNAIIDEFVAQLAEGQVRNFAKWTAVSPDRGSIKDYNDGVTGWEGEIVHLKGWLKERVDFMDEQFVSPPGFNPAGGLVDKGATVAVRTGGSLFSPQSAYLTTDGSDPRKRGNTPNDTAKLAPKSITIDETVTYVVRAEQSDRWSGPITMAFVVDGIPASRENLLISEIMYHPSGGNAAEAGKGFFDEDYFEYVELMNAGDKDMYIGDVSFTGGIRFPFSESAIQALKPGERVVLVSDLEAFAIRYGNDVPVGGEFVGQLDNGGESLVLMRGEEVIQDFSYNDREPWPVTPDQFGFSLTLTTPMSGLNLGDSGIWSVDMQVAGSPGSPGKVPPAVVVNEVLANSGETQADGIELFNETSDTVDLSGWFLTDDASEPTKFGIPAGTTIPAGGYVVFRQDNDSNPANNSGLSAEFFGNSFGLNSTGDSVYLFSATADGALTGYRDGFSFGDVEEGSSFGRHITSSGDAHYVIQNASTLGEANAGPLQSPVVITEIMYNPPATPLADAEYLEVHNQSSAAVDLFHADMASAAWRVVGVDFGFLEGVTLAAGETALIVNVDPEAFRAAYGLATSVKIFGPMAGRLDNAGETVQLQKPIVVAGDTPDVRYVTVDEVEYNDKAPWPLEADGTGASIERTAASAYANESASWRASAAGTPGVYAEGPDPEPSAALSAWMASEFTAAELANAAVSGLSADPDRDGLVNLAEYALNTSAKSADASPLSVAEVVEGNDAYLSVSFNRRKGAAVSIGLEASSNLNQWVAVAGANSSSVDLGNGVERVTMRDSQARGVNVSRYVRLRIESN